MNFRDYHTPEDLEMFENVGELTQVEFNTIYEDYEDEKKRIGDTNSTQYAAIEKEQKYFLYCRCATDIELFALVYFAHYLSSKFNLFHLDAFNNYTLGERAVRRADSAPRGFAKSTIKAVIKPVHDICYRLERYIVMVSNTKPQAVSKLKDIRSELQENSLLVDNYGPFFKSGNVGTEDYICCSNGIKIRLHAVGSGTEIRGARFGSFRPSKIINDDVEHSEHCESEEQREKMENWYKEVISKIGNEHTNIEFVGTVIHQQSLLKSLIVNPKYKSKEYRAIISWSERRDLWDKWKTIYINLDNEERQRDAKDFFQSNREEMLKGTKVLWPDRFDYYYLQEEIIEIGIRAFMKEMQNDPMSSEEKPFNESDTSFCRVEDDGIRLESSGKLIPFTQLTSIGTIDPSAGQTKPSGKKKADYTCILTGYWHEKTRRLFVVKDFTKRVPPSKYIGHIFDSYEIYKYYNFGVETNLFRNLLLKNIKDEQDRRNSLKKSEAIKKNQEFDEDDEIRIKFYEINQTENKEKRIYTLEPKIFHRHIVLSRDLSQEFLGMLWDFPFGTHDDGPDALEMLWGLATGKYGKGGVRAKARAR